MVNTGWNYLSDTNYFVKIGLILIKLYVCRQNLFFSIVLYNAVSHLEPWCYLSELTVQHDNVDEVCV